MLFTFLGFVAGTLTTVAFLPQVLHTYRSKAVAGLSYVTLITFSVGVLLWFIYGLYLRSWPMILANGVTLVLQFPLLFMKLRYGGPSRPQLQQNATRRNDVMRQREAP